MTVSLIGGYAYQPNALHRNRAPTKSQWTIPVPAEETCFDLAVTSEWFDTNRRWAWSLHLHNGRPDYLGVTATNKGFPLLDLIVAIFDVGAVTHGYPADTRSNREKPPLAVQAEWISLRHLTKAKIKKLVAGKRCAL